MANDRPPCKRDDRLLTRRAAPLRAHRPSPVRLAVALTAALLFGSTGCRTTKPPDPTAAPAGQMPAAGGAAQPADGLPGVSVKDFREDSTAGAPAKGWSAFNPKNIKRGFMTLIGQGPNEQIARIAYSEGDVLFREKQYAEAAKLYRKAARRWPESTLEEDALFMAGESYFFADQYYKASDEFAALLKAHENSRHLDRVVVRDFAIARYWESQADKHTSWLPNFSDKTMPHFDAIGNAIAVYESIRLNDPTGPLADDALFATANAYFVRSRYEDADYHYDLIRKEYPRSEFQMQAHVLGLRAKLRTYQGAEYDEKPLNESEKLIDVTLVQFAADMPDERERLIRARKAIRIQKAEREWENGEYYYRRHYYRAARYHYSSLLKDYPDTNFADMAQARLDETKSYRPVPKNYFLWIGRIFGERKRD